MSRNNIYKLKITGIVIGVTAGIFLIFKYLLPLAAPFVFALIFAFMVERPVNFLEKKFHIKRIVSATVLLVLIMGVVGAALFLAGKSLMEQAGRLMENYDLYVKNVGTAVCDYCNRIDRTMKFETGTSYEFVMVQMEKASDSVTQTFMSNVMDKSWSVVSAITMAFTVLAFVIMATVFFSRDMQKMKESVSKSPFRKELYFLGGRMKFILGTYIKTQLIIMLLTSAVCTIGLYLMGNPYAFLFGVLIGIMDALPVLGTGLVFIPWTVVMILMGNFRSAAILFIIYMICYYGRQFLEPKLMGSKLGVSPILMLVSVYLGLVLFGITGVITGPIAAILIREVCAVLINGLSKDNGDSIIK